MEVLSTVTQVVPDSVLMASSGQKDIPRKAATVSAGVLCECTSLHACQHASRLGGKADVLVLAQAASCQTQLACRITRCAWTIFPDTLPPAVTPMTLSARRTVGSLSFPPLMTSEPVLHACRPLLRGRGYMTSAQRSQGTRSSRVSSTRRWSTSALCSRARSRATDA